MSESDPVCTPEESRELVAAPIALTRQLEQLVDKRINILRRIHETGSISEAARLSGVSYKAAWQALETLANLAGVPLVEKEVGGNKGGGTRLTATGEEVLKLADELTRARAEVLVRFRLKDSPALKNVGVSSLRTSMRNQFPAVIEKLKIGSAQVRLILSIDDTHYIRASCTKESALQMQFLKQPQGVQRHTHLLILLRVFLTAIGSAPFQSHLKAFFHIGIRNGLI